MTRKPDNPSSQRDSPTVSARLSAPDDTTEKVRVPDAAGGGGRNDDNDEIIAPSDVLAVPLSLPPVASVPPAITVTLTLPAAAARFAAERAASFHDGDVAAYLRALVERQMQQDGAPGVVGGAAAAETPPLPKTAALRNRLADLLTTGRAARESERGPADWERLQAVVLTRLQQAGGATAGPRGGRANEPEARRP